ncbi:MAG TPA: mannose-6-phosphate isomerase, class I [Chitinophagaceae bacterium]
MDRLIKDTRLFKLKGKVQHYAWGGYEFIPRLLGVENNAHQPYAEYWLGAHDKAASEVLLPDHSVIPLPEFIAASPQEYLGTVVAKRFGRLPFLFKVLDVHEMLSIQVHPTKAEAEKGFARENAAGIPLHASNRNYKDDNHKPEVMVALSEFWLLHGFLPEEKLRKVLQEVMEFSVLLPVFDQEGYYGLYRHVMEMPQEEVNKLLLPLVQQAVPLYQAGALRRSDPAYWAAKALVSGMTRTDQLDRGIFSIYFFNIVQLHPGEGIFQAAGIPHAYLEGQNMELMANSDNVLRGGLTPKHVDVAELLKHTRFEGIVPNPLKGEDTNGRTEQVYSCPVPDFTISKIEVNPSQSFHNEPVSMEIIILIKGLATIKGSVMLSVGKGESVLVLPGERYEIAASGDAILYKAAVPVNR